jgi:hypothetical protein
MQPEKSVNLHLSVKNVPHTPIKEGELLRQEGLLDVFGATNVQIAYPCVFKLTDGLNACYLLRRCCALSTFH